MALDKFLIAPFEVGLETDVKPFLIPDDAFSQLDNAYVFRGRVKKRFGSRLMRNNQLLSRLRILIGTTDHSGAGGLTGQIGFGAPVKVPGTVFQIGQMFSIGTEIFTVYQTGAPVDMLTTGASTTKTFNTTDGAVVIVGAAPDTECYWYPATPVMGLTTYQKPTINYEELIAFDTQFAYHYGASGWLRYGTANASPDLWTGTDSQFFCGATYRGIGSNEAYLFVTNNNTADKIRYWNGSTWTSRDYVLASKAGTLKLTTAKFIIPFKNRLLFLNVIEKDGIGADKNFSNRIRFSINGDPTIEATSFDADIPGRGGFLDATTKEAIISAQIIRDRLIIFFESSTYELAYTGIPAKPFIFKQLNGELGTESTFSTVVFDKHVLGIGNTGVHACNGASVSRIDDKIPDEVFRISNENDGVERVHGIRDYATEMVYWTIPVPNIGARYPKKILVFNYKNGSWAMNDDSITCFGYYQSAVGVTWGELHIKWAENHVQWGSGAYEPRFQNVVAGNQEGFLFIIDPDLPRNAPSLQITQCSIDPATGIATLYVRNHNLSVGDFVGIEDSSTGSYPLIVPVVAIDDTTPLHIIKVGPIVPISTPYIGGWTLARVSKMNICTKHFNFYFKDGKNMTVPVVDFFVEKTLFGEITVDVSTSSSSASLLADGKASGALLGTNVLLTRAFLGVPYEFSQKRFWRKFYPQANGETVQLRMSLSDDQMIDANVSLSPFELNAMIFYATPTAR